MNNYTLKVYEVRRDETDADGTVILQFQGRLTSRTHREMREALEAGRVQIREHEKVLA